MIRHLLRFRAVADVFSQSREHRSDSLSAERLRGDECVVQRFPWHEARHAFPHKLVMRSMVAQPAVLGSSQQKGTHQTHNVFCPRKPCMQALAAPFVTLDSKLHPAKLRARAERLPPATLPPTDPALE